MPAASGKGSPIEARPLEELLNGPGPLARRLHQICTSVFLEEASEFNLTAIQFTVISTIGRYPGIDLVTLGKIVAHDRQTISNVITRLTRRGFVDRRDRNKRTHALYLTDAARSIRAEMENRMEKMDQLILSPLKDSERRRFLELLRRLVEANNDLSRAPMANDVKQSWLEEPVVAASPARGKSKPKKSAQASENA